MPPPGRPDETEIQGNVVGFNKNFQRFVFLQFNDAAAARAFLARIEPSLATAREVRHFNRLYKEIAQRRGELGSVESAWANLALTFHGLQVLDAPNRETLPEEFQEGMAQRAAEIGDTDDSAPATWVQPFAQQIDAVMILAADTLTDLDDAYGRLTAKIEPPGVAEMPPHLDGSVRPAPNTGREHFGFKDGISQPGIGGLTISSKRGQDTIAAGEFLIGYPREDGIVSGTAENAPGPGEEGYPNTPATQALPPWAKDGSFLVIRRLRQDVKGFNDGVAQSATTLGLDASLVGAKLVGRWASGAPVEPTRHGPKGVDPATADPSAADPAILNDEHINDFDYAPGDEDGHNVPLAAHIRKVNPRSATPPTKAVTRQHRILRRGIPYGTEFTPEEQPYGTVVPPEQDRGLIFACYQSSIRRGFEFVQSTWANAEDFPAAGAGRDALISQDVATRDFDFTPRNVHLSLARWVTTTGGAYFFAPSLSAIRMLAVGGTNAA